MKSILLKRFNLTLCVFLSIFSSFVIVHKGRCEGEGEGGGNWEVRYGIKVCPVYSIFSVTAKDNSNIVVPLESKFGFEAGPIISFNFKANHAITAGIHYFTQGFSVTEKTNTTADADKKDVKNEKKAPQKRDFWVSYINMPVGVEFHSNEFWIDTNLYMLTGVIFCVKMFEGTPKILHEKEDLFERFKVCFIIGGGIEYEFAMNTSIFADLSFRTDLFNTLTTKSDSANPIVKLFNHTLGMSIGIRF